MSTALRANLNTEVIVQFPEDINFSDGSFYIAALETEEVLLVSCQVQGAVDFHAGSEKPVVTGSFWEESIGYDYDLEDEDEQPGVLRMRVGGEFAFELDDAHGLEDVDIDDGAIHGITIAWSPDGDTPATLGDTQDVQGELDDTEEDDDFEEL